ncbi:MAG TPA: phosphotransferase, partial [Candidatus Norongarragalinales archaeon]|nr:phosphotransferase [Candidatus Norongarragalinales archaeon]
DAVEKLFWLHHIRTSSLNPGLRARIEEEDLRRNEWIVEEAIRLHQEKILTDSSLKTVKMLCAKVKDNPLIGKAKKVLTHGDARIQNFYLDDNGKLQLRDFEHANINSPLLDAASFYYSIPDSPFRDVFKRFFKERFLAIFSGSDKEFSEAFQYFIVHRLIAWLKFNTTFTKDVGEKTAQLRVDEAAQLLEKLLKSP